MRDLIFDLLSLYNEDEQKALISKTKNYKWDPFDNLNIPYSGLLFLPLTLTNPDKELIVRHIYKSRIVTQLAENANYLTELCAVQDYDKPSIKVVICVRGWTFLDAWAKEHGYTFLNRETMYLQTNVNHRIRVYQKNKHIFIITNEQTDVLNKRLFTAIPLFFKEDFTWTEELINYFRNMETDKENCLEFIKKTIKNSKILENLKYERLLETITDLSNYTVLQHIQTKDRLESTIRGLEDQLKQYYLEHQKEQAFIAFYKPEANMEDTTKYIYNNPYIVDYFQYSQNYFIIAIEAPLEYIDVSAFKQMLKNPQSYLYPRWGETSPLSYSELTRNHPIEFVEFIKDLFLSNKYRVYTRAEIVLDLDRKEAKPLRRHSGLMSRRPRTWKLEERAKNNKDKCIVPHMHIEYYDCWSGNKTNISKALLKNDLIGAIDICINTTKDINVNDSAVFGRFIKEELIKPKEMATGQMPQECSRYDGVPGDEYKTILDIEKNCFRTFLDIFVNDYIKDKEQADLSEETTKILYNEELL